MHPSDVFTVEVSRRLRAAVVAPFGELDVATVDRLRARLRECEDAEAVVLDMRGVEFMDTSGLQLIFEQQRRAQEGAFELVVVRGSRQLQRLFEIAGFADRLRFVDDPAEAA